ncbi:hypothetical protein N7519_011291 [Penicillium mononematosum]|uniref:uncharacterized protein n=1 Tax=Penicillium mononematosum TaxID=268346 RepID=UPI00254693A8|nr:uncharacterized protein N7519_011291 [Penicillium mononematosum]KAJ6180830.1 hypothetical protein N7519_011291 [Penicillium mononematosum]
MGDYNVRFTRLQPTISPPMQVLEAAGVRYCVVGDLVVMALGGPLLLTDMYFAVADDQLELARTALASHGFDELPQTHLRFFSDATKESSTGWPGYRFVPHEADPDDGPDRYWATSTIIIPATFWHLDLSPESFTTTTFLVPDTGYRFPFKLVYLRAIIDAVAQRHADEELNGQISSYFLIQYAYLLGLLRDVLACLPDEDQFFIDFFDRVILYNTRKKVCYLRQQIRDGLITYETARDLLPKSFLKLEALKAKYRKLGYGPKGGKPSIRFPPDSSNVPQRQNG